MLTKKMGRDGRSHSNLWLCFTGVVFSTVVVISTCLFLLWVVFYKLGLTSINVMDFHYPFVSLLFGSMVLGFSLSVFVGRWVIRPLLTFCDAFDLLSGGDFSVRIPTSSRIAEIREMAEHFNEAAYELSQIETLRSDFVANVSHEIKTPVATIEGYATLLQDEKLDDARRSRYVDKVLSATRQLSDLVSDVLTISKLESDDCVITKREFRLDEQLRRIILLLEDSWSERKIEFELELPKVIYCGDDQLLSHVWLNLLENAIKFSPEGGVVSVTLRANDEAVEVSVADGGCGMSDEVQRHIFEKFYQGDRSHTSEGSGLGLAMVKRIVELSEGDVRVASKPGEGSEFVVQLPR